MLTENFEAKKRVVSLGCRILLLLTHGRVFSLEVKSHVWPNTERLTEAWARG